jgi:hypothetical protein
MIKPIEPMTSPAPESTASTISSPIGLGHPIGLERERNIHDIEPYLKWAAVAYGGGFATVLVHTAILGVPVIQVIDPLNVWIGLPIAISLYFVDKWIKGVLKISAEIALSTKRLLHADDTTSVQPTGEQLYDGLISAYASVLSLGAFIPKRFTIWIAHRLYPKKMILPRLSASMLDDKTVGLIRRFLTTTNEGVTAFKRSLDLLNLCMTLPFILGVYVLVIYPLIPQPWGGGRPMDAEFIVETNKMPPELPQLATLFDAPTEQSEKPATGRATVGQDPSRSEQRARSTATLRLRFQSEHAYLVQRKNGPVLSISKEVVSAVLFHR